MLGTPPQYSGKQIKDAIFIPVPDKPGYFHCILCPPGKPPKKQSEGTGYANLGSHARTHKGQFAKVMEEAAKVNYDQEAIREHVVVLVDSKVIALIF